MKFATALIVLTTFCTLPGTIRTALAHPDHIVLGYVPCRRDAIASPDDFNYDAFTHLARAFIREQEDGSLTIPADYFSESFEAAARRHGVKLLMSIGGGSVEADHWPALARDPQHVELFLDNVDKLLVAHRYDGIDIDWEPAPTTDADGLAYAAFLKSLHARFPKTIITLAMSPTKKGTAHLPMDEVAASVDYINAMTYSYATPSSGLASFNGNLKPDVEGAHTRHSVVEDMQNLIENHRVPPAKILLGINFWACRYRVDKIGDKYPAHSKGFADDIAYPEVVELINTGKYTVFHDAVADASYITAKRGGCVITYDDPDSVKAKCEMSKQLACAGVMIWHTGADLGGGETPLLNVIEESFGIPPSPISRPALEREIVRLGKRPVPPGATLDALQKSDAQLRAELGLADDQKWFATPATKTK